jgi:hypothetical protein
MATGWFATYPPRPFGRSHPHVEHQAHRCGDLTRHTN